MSDRMTFDDLRSILVEAAGSAGEAPLGPEAVDADLYELGYDSLALMETSAYIRARFRVDIPEAELAELRTLRQILNCVNALVLAGEGSPR
ncbi:acyl carrier protein [Amycolatopsis solani]|uniref:acyl carrier protein n=1 Tax=Amycolatopsis solani TaxID=3028615 RepID=UPI0025B11382|nr:acyl carrier protein [Amycolatopsis sp. MEP2-6]